MIVKESVLFCSECWLDKWHENAMNAMENGEIEARRHALRTRIDANRSPNESIRPWILGALKMTRKLKEHPQKDIWRYFNG